MLYQAIEAHLASLTPARLTARWMHQMMSHPMLPHSYTTGFRAAAAWFELFDRATQRRLKPAFGLDATLIDDAPVAVREEVVVEKPFCRLLHFARDLRLPRHDPHVLVVAPMSGHHASLLRGTVETLLPAHEVYITDWTDARLVPLSAGGFDLADYIDYIIDFLRVLGPETHVIAVCQPSPPVLAATARDGRPTATLRRPKSLTLMGGPVDTRVSPTAVNGVGASQSLDWFERQGDRDLVPPRLSGRDAPGLSRLPAARRLHVHEPGPPRAIAHRFLPSPGGGRAAKAPRAHRPLLRRISLGDGTCRRISISDTIRHVFQEHSLPVGTFTHRGEKVEPDRDPQDRADDHRRRARRYLRPRPDQGRPRPLPQHPRRQAPPSRAGRRRPLRHLQRPQMAPVHLPGVGGVRAQGV